MNRQKTSERCQLRRHFAVVDLGGDRVLLHSEGGSRVLSGPLYAQLVPLLDGRFTRSELASTLKDDFRREEVLLALNRMQRLGLLSNTSSAGVAADSGFLDSVGGDANDLAARQARSVIRMLGCGDVGRLQKAVDAALQEAGWSVSTTDGDVALIVTDSYLHVDVEPLVNSLMESSVPFLLLKPVGRVIWLGPCVGLRPPGGIELASGTESNDGVRDRFDAGLLFRRLRQNEPTTGPVISLPGFDTASSMSMALGMAMTCFNNFVAGGEHSSLAHSLLTVDLSTMASRWHRVPHRASDVELMDGHQAWSLKACPRLPGQPSGSRTCSPEETVARLERHLSPVTGIVRHIERVTEAPGYVYGASYLHPYAEYEDDAVALRETTSHVGFSHGKGASSEQSRASCLSEAMERYSACYQGTEATRRASARSLGEAACTPSELSQFSAQQYAHRDQLNAVQALSHFVPCPFDADAEMEWTACWSLTEEQSRWLPSAHCFLNYPVVDFCLASSNGCAAGNTREEAIVQGFLELAERDAVAIWWYNRIPRPAIGSQHLVNVQLDAAVRFHESIGRSLHLLDVTADLGIPTVVAVSARHDGGGIHLRSGAHFDPAIAATRALTELNQAAPFDQISTDGIVERSFGTASWLTHANLADHPYLLPSTDAVAGAIVARPHSEDILDDVRLMVACCRQAGLNVLLLDLTRPDTGFPVVRVTVPGIRHWTRQLGPGRLYDVPVGMGWLSEPTPEESTNPTPWPC